jgi:hypothetical protein
MSKRYLGGEPVTSRAQVIRYLMENYYNGSEEAVTEAEAMEAVMEHKDMIDKAIDPFKSNVYYVGDQIGEAKGWTELDPDEDDEDDEEDEDEDY